MSFDRKFLLCALGYLIAGLCLGLAMAASHNHAQHVTHAHILLAGAVLSFVYAIIHKLWLAVAVSVVATVQFVLHQAGALLMTLSLFLLFGNIVPGEQIEPILAGSSIAVLLSALLMLFMIIQAKPSRA